MSRLLSAAFVLSTLFGFGTASRSYGNDRYGHGGHGGGSQYHGDHHGHGISSHRVPSNGYHHGSNYGNGYGYGAGLNQAYQAMPLPAPRFVPQPMYPSPYTQQYPVYGNGYGAHQHVDHHRLHLDIGPLHFGLGH